MVDLFKRRREGRALATACPLALRPYAGTIVFKFHVIPWT